MEEKNKETLKSNDEKPARDCGCSDGNCKPKKKNLFSKLIFAAILLAALAIIGVKVLSHSNSRTDKQTGAAFGKASCCDTTKSKPGDTTKTSSCCSKK